MTIKKAMTLSFLTMSCFGMEQFNSQKNEVDNSKLFYDGMAEGSLDISLLTLETLKRIALGLYEQHRTMDLMRQLQFVEFHNHNNERLVRTHQIELNNIFTRNNIARSGLLEKNMKESFSFFENFRTIHTDLVDKGKNNGEAFVVSAQIYEDICKRHFDNLDNYLKCQKEIDDLYSRVVQKIAAVDPHCPILFHFPQELKFTTKT